MIDGLWNPRYYSDAVSEGQAIGPLTPNFRAPAENCRGFFISRNWTHALHRSIENQANVGSGSIASLRTGSKASPNVRYAFDSGRICASQRTDAMGPGCVKSRKFNLHLELPSRFRRFENEQCKQLPSREDNKENDSTLFLPMRLFTQAGPIATVGVEVCLQAELTCRRLGEIS
jgi:hypothetical protein